MTFFTTPELLEIGDIPFTTALQKPTREEALEYYRKVTEHYHLDIRQYEWVKTVMGEDGNFSITATDRAGRPHDYRTRKVIVSTGYYDLANQLGTCPARICPRSRTITPSLILITTPTCW